MNDTCNHKDITKCTYNDLLVEVSIPFVIANILFSLSFIVLTYLVTSRLQGYLSKNNYFILFIFNIILFGKSVMYVV